MNKRELICASFVAVAATAAPINVGIAQSGDDDDVPDLPTGDENPDLPPIDEDD